MSDLLSQFDDVEKAPRQPARKGILDANTLVRELALGVLQLILDGEEATPDAVKAARPVLAEAYTQRHSVLPSYMGAGRSEDGLSLWRHRKSKGYSASRENGALCLLALARQGAPLDGVAEALGLEDGEALVAKVNALPAHGGEVANG